MKSIIVDTNVILRFLLNDIPEQKEACEQLFNKAKHNEIKLYVSQAIVFEIDFVLRKYYLYEKSVVIESLRPLIATKYINVESRDIFISALSLYKKNNVSFVDCFLLTKANLENAELFTFDKKLAKLQ
ncbi:MAG TPA: PIN domain-containing protein [Patescibacteria group bacterium]|nr:PIN domain-containing protein [Patescibacteria group bacterium]